MPIFHPTRDDYNRVSSMNLERTRAPMIQEALIDIEAPSGWQTERFPTSIRFHKHRATLPSVSMRTINPTQLRVELDRKVNGKVVTESSVHTSAEAAREALLGALQQVIA